MSLAEGDRRVHDLLCSRGVGVIGRSNETVARTDIPSLLSSLGPLSFIAVTCPWARLGFSPILVDRGS